MVLLNFLLAIIVDAFSVVKDNTSESTGLHEELGQMMREKWRAMLGRMLNIHFIPSNRLSALLKHWAGHDTDTDKSKELAIDDQPKRIKVWATWLHQRPYECLRFGFWMGCQRDEDNMLLMQRTATTHTRCCRFWITNWKSRSSRMYWQRQCKQCLPPILIWRPMRRAGAPTLARTRTAVHTSAPRSSSLRPSGSWNALDSLQMVMVTMTRTRKRCATAHQPWLVDTYCVHQSLRIHSNTCGQRQKG